MNHSVTYGYANPRSILRNEVLNIKSFLNYQKFAIFLMFKLHHRVFKEDF